MKAPTKPVFYMLLFTGILIFIVLLMQPISVYHFREYLGLIFPSGAIALEERNLLFIIQALMLLVIIPVYILTFIFSWKYRASNPKGVYDPDLVDNKIAEMVWWGLPLVITLIIAALTWVKTEKLDPFKPIVSENREITIQVVALQWKWLFIYPEEKIASINFVQIPKDTPIKFVITADAPMNSFWIPSLGGQIYAMPKMKTEMHLIANEEGDYRGVSANISGEGFADMTFIARSSTRDEYQKWVKTAQQTPLKLNAKEYTKLAAPSISSKEIFKLEDNHLFDQIIDKYMHP